MPNMSMCSGTNCPLKETCYRYKAVPGFMQSHFAETPYDSEREECDFYWPTEILKHGKDNTRV